MKKLKYSIIAMVTRVSRNLALNTEIFIMARLCLVAEEHLAGKQPPLRLLDMLARHHQVHFMLHPSPNLWPAPPRDASA
ncbi:hypothetical protein Thiowin_01982 [Thiorhodovibrio winogradskyi]|uniref:Uncharacterized protein n=1 Tax=Thiorhodovibrio winogradskyi TaxID=77007 RepID=A0ABZ0S8P8_9GAMM